MSSISGRRLLRNLPMFCGKVFGGSVSARVFPELTAGCLLFLLGICGYINTQATMTLARTKEFAIFQSMGMSRKKIFQMILWECFCYVFVSSAIAVTAGCLYSLTILKKGIQRELLSTGWVMTYQFTMFPSAIST